MIFTGNYGRRRAGNGQSSSSNSSQRSRASREVFFVVVIFFQFFLQDSCLVSATCLIKIPWTTAGVLSGTVCVFKCECHASIWGRGSENTRLTDATNTKNSRQKYYKTAVCNKNSAVSNKFLFLLQPIFLRVVYTWIHFVKKLHFQEQNWCQKTHLVISCKF